MPSKLANTDYTDGFTTTLTKPEKQVKRFIDNMQPVCMKVILMNAGSFAESTVRESVKQLEEKNVISQTSTGSYKLTGESL